MRDYHSFLPSLTGLRFYAALLVVIYHFNSYVGTVPVVSQLARFGRTGVTFFFVLSGFVLAWSYWGRSTPLRVFYWRRFARIWPLHIATTLVAGSVYAYTDHRLSDQLTWGNLWPAVLLIHTWFPSSSVNWGWSGASWSLADEAFFYAIFPFLVMLFAGRRQSQLLVVPLAVTAFSLLCWIAIPMEGVGPYFRSLLLDYFPVSRATHFILGVALACLLRKGWRSPIAVNVAVALVVGWHALLFFWSEVVDPTSQWYPYSASQLFAAIPFAIVIASVATRDLDGKSSHMSRPIFVMLGQSSFAWYLLHVPIIMLIVHAFGDSQPDSVWVLILWIVGLTVSQLIAIATYLWFEHPVEKKLRSWVSGTKGKSLTPGKDSGHYPGGLEVSTSDNHR